jgi:hypothetical protein
MRKPDTDIKRDVDLELKWDPDIDATDIAVSVSTDSTRRDSLSSVA